MKDSEIQRKVNKMSKIELKYNPCNDRWHGERLYFKEDSDGNFSIINMDEELIGHIERIRCGQWMQWCLLLEQDCYLTPGCNDEAREMQRKCYSIKKFIKLGKQEE